MMMPLLNGRREKEEQEEISDTICRREEEIREKENVEKKKKIEKKKEHREVEREENKREAQRE